MSKRGKEEEQKKQQQQQQQLIVKATHHWLLRYPDNCVNRKRTLKTGAAAVIDLIHHHCYCCCYCGQPQPETNHPKRQ